MVRQYLYPDYYYAHLDANGLEKMRNHSGKSNEGLVHSSMLKLTT